jgi:hypothetical protein
LDFLRIEGLKLPNSRTLDHPVFAQPQPTPDPTKFRVKHPSDGPAYAEIDQLNKAHKLAAMPFPAPRGGTEPTLTLEEVLGGNSQAIATITNNKQIVFHSGGDCGNTRGPSKQNEVSDKMVSDFDETVPSEIPQFHMLLGDVVYSFGEVQYYYDQFYEPYREYPAPILAAAGNHDGMVAPETHAKSLDGFLRNFCASSFVVQPEAGGLSRTAQIQPGVFFTFEAPFVRILVLYSNVLEDPGVIADDNIGNSQVKYLQAALKRVRDENYTGALLIAHHHPIYTHARHGWSVEMLSQIDAACKAAGVWPHAVLAGHAHNYQRFTRTRSDGTQIPYIVCGNTGHNVQKLTRSNVPLRTPQVIQKAGAKTDQVVFENYDDTNYGYLRVIATNSQIRIEYHPASDGTTVKTPDDFVTVDLKTRKLTQYNAQDLGYTSEAKKVDSEAKKRPYPPAWLKNRKSKTTHAKTTRSKTTHSETTRSKTTRSKTASKKTTHKKPTHKKPNRGKTTHRKTTAKRRRKG